MMNIAELAQKWQSLTGPPVEKIRSLRISASCVPDLFVGITPAVQRCLILRLPIGYEADFQSSVRQNLSLELYTETKWVVLTLLDELFNDLFDDLIFSIYNKISNTAEAGSYVSDLLKTYYKWSEFFQDSNSNALSDENVKGIFGELVALNEMITEQPSASLNDLLNSWKGPFDTGHDFIGELKNTEVKTREQPAAHIKISSEYQLQADAGKTLELQVVDIEKDPARGFSLKDAVMLLRDNITSRLGDYTIILHTLSQKGLTPRNLIDYEHLRFLPLRITGYDVNEGFPKIIRSELTDTINTVSYKINLPLVSGYMLFEKTLQWK